MGGVREISGDTFFVTLKSPPPIIPEGDGRPCPQCHQIAWNKSRYCWHCNFDFDRATIRRFHPAKLLCISAALNAALFTWILACELR